MSFPKELLYNKNHSWVKKENGKCKVGIVKYSVDKADQIVFINLPSEGKELNIGDVYVSVESVKWSGHLESPVKGKVVKVNEKLFDEPELINEDPYGSWIMEVEVEDYGSLMDSEEAKNEYEG